MRLALEQHAVLVDPEHAHYVQFTAQTRMSGIDLPGPTGQPAREIRKGAGEAIGRHVQALGGVIPPELAARVVQIARGGATPLIVADGRHILGLMYLNTYELNHVWFSHTRMFMTFIMAGSLALVMLSFMRDMYKDKRANLVIIVDSIALIGLGLGLVRSQSTVRDGA